MKLPWRRTPKTLPPAPIQETYTFAKRTVEFLGKLELSEMMIKDVRVNARANRIDITGWVIRYVWADLGDRVTCTVTASVPSLDR